MHPTNLSRGAWGAARFRGQCVSATSAGGLGGQRFKLAISRRGARARTFNLLAPAQVECDESGAFGEWFKRPWGEQWAKGPEVSVNLHWWSRRSVLQVSDFEAAGRGHGPLRARQYDTSTLVRLVQLARASSVPAVRNSRSIGRGVRGFKLVMVSAVCSAS